MTIRRWPDGHRDRHRSSTELGTSSKPAVLATFRNERLSIIDWAGHDRHDRPAYLPRAAADAPEGSPLCVVTGQVEPSLPQSGRVGAGRASQETRHPPGLATSYGCDVGLAQCWRGQLDEPRGMREHAEHPVCPDRVAGPLSQGHELDSSSHATAGARSAADSASLAGVDGLAPCPAQELLDGSDLAGNRPIDHGVGEPGQHVPGRHGDSPL
jgi:hypothetical protein